MASSEYTRRSCRHSLIAACIFAVHSPMAAAAGAVDGPNTAWLRSVRASFAATDTVVWLAFAPHGGGKLTFAQDLHRALGGVAVWGKRAYDAVACFFATHRCIAGGEHAPMPDYESWFKCAGALDQSNPVDGAQSDDWYVREMNAIAP